mmetsp:Transcript_62544/g.176797  ORF Transcript_62544/g.176797 Transcript_62544/m.176797 type:complete len:209 (+) Transcript_62544:597-1223(+)
MPGPDLHPEHLGVVRADGTIVVGHVQAEGDGVPQEDHQEDDLDWAYLPAHDDGHEERQPDGVGEHRAQHDGSQHWVAREEQDADPRDATRGQDRLQRARHHCDRGLCAHPNLGVVVRSAGRQGRLTVSELQVHVPLVLVLQELVCGGTGVEVAPEAKRGCPHFAVDDPDLRLITTAPAPPHDVLVEVSGREPLTSKGERLCEGLNPAI